MPMKWKKITLRFRAWLLMTLTALAPLIRLFPGRGARLLSCRQLAEPEPDERGRFLLILDNSMPEHDRSAGGRFSRQYIEQFLRMGYLVFFLPRDRRIRNPYYRQLLDIGVRFILPFNIAKWLNRYACYFDFFYLLRPDSETCLEPILEKKKTGSIIAYFGYDLSFVRLRRQAEITGDQGARVAAEKMERMETRLFNAADVIHVVGNVEKNLVESMFPSKLVRNIPLLLFSDDDRGLRRADFEKRAGLLFVGSYRHAPNMDAVQWFLDEIWGPLGLWRQSIAFTIVGSGYPEGTFGEWADRNVVVRADLPDAELARMYAENKLMIVPLRYGAGVKGKILEAMNFGLPVLSSPIGLEGIEVPGEGVAVADSKEEWLSTIPALYSDNTSLAGMASSAGQFIAKEYSPSKARRIISECMPIARRDEE
jgi:O-antigen biosynthesis protein